MTQHTTPVTTPVARPGVALGTAHRVDEDELRRRLIRRDQYVSCDQAFIDCRTPGSDLKENYSIIGPGVTQSSQQVVNLREPHGFNVGAAAMPDGVVNSLHLHFTAEVFLTWRGSWSVRWGTGGADGELVLDEGDIISVPTWIFRAFTNVGGDYGWLFTVLGFDNTGGIVWDPGVLREAARHGLYLTADNALVDTVAGEPMPHGDDLVPPMPSGEIERLRAWTPEQMRERVVRRSDLRWSRNPFLCSDLPGGRAQLAAVIGYGMTEDRDQVPPIHYPHSFNAAWLRATAGEGMLRHRHHESQVLMGYRGRWEVLLNEGDEQLRVVLQPYDSLSVPPGTWRTLVALDDDAELLVVNSGDARVRIEWPQESIRHALDKGACADAAGYVAPWNVVRYSTLDD